jgi:two-component system, NarL family, sensor kinase
VSAAASILQAPTSTDSQAGAAAALHPAAPRPDPTAWLAVLRLLLLPIVFAGDRLVAHPVVGTARFNLIFAAACVYALLALLDSRRRRARPPLWLLGGLDLLFVCGLTYESGGAFSQLHWAFVCLPLGAAILLDPRRTAAVAGVTGAAYLVVALTHPSAHERQLDLILVQGLYIAWAGVVAVVLSGLLARRRVRIEALASERGSLVAQALAAEARARQRLAEGLHDTAIQNLLAARQDLAEARAGEGAGIERAERAVRLTLDQLRATVRELHPYVLDQLGLEAALDSVCEQHVRRGGYELVKHIDPRAAGVCDELIFSLVRELLANVTRHASAKHVTLELESGARAVILTVSDDGCGLDARKLTGALRHGHIGLASCRERVHATRGSFEISCPLGRGTTIRCVVPRASAAAAHHTADHRSVEVGPLTAVVD